MRTLISLVALSLVILHRFVPDVLPSDTLGLGLLIIAVLPWILAAVPVSEVEILGMRLKLSDVIVTQEQHREELNEQALVIRNLVVYSMSASIFRHLCGIGVLKEYNLDFNETNLRELYFLRDNGFIEPQHDSFLDFGAERNVARVAKLTPIGWFLLGMRKAEVPGDWTSPENLPNLKVNPETLPLHGAFAHA